MNPFPTETLFAFASFTLGVLFGLPVLVNRLPLVLPGKIVTNALFALFAFVGEITILGAFLSTNEPGLHLILLLLIFPGLLMCVTVAKAIPLPENPPQDLIWVVVNVVCLMAAAIFASILF